MRKVWKALVTVALTLLIAVSLWGCEEKQPELQAETDNVIIAWNVEAYNYRGKPGDVYTRSIDEDG